MQPAVWLGTLIASVTAIMFYSITAKSIESDARQRFTNHARNAQNSINARIKSYTDVLRATAGLFQTSDPLQRSQFQQYVDGLDLPQHYPAIHTINYAQYVVADDVPEFLRKVRREQSSLAASPGLFSIKPPGKRDDYCVLTFIDGTPVARAAFGLDLLANPLVRTALMTSRDTGELNTSGVPIAAMSGPNKTGLGMRLPVYRPGMPRSSTLERRAAYIGSVGIAISVDTLVQSVLDEMAVKRIRLTLVDTGLGLNNEKIDAVPRERLLFDSAFNAAHPTPPLPSAGNGFVVPLPVDFNGRLWKATFSAPKDAIYTTFDEYFPWMAMAAGFVSTFLLYALFHTMSSSRRHAITMAKEMTKELRDSEAQLQLSHQNLRRLAAHAERIKEGERKRIAREIHDDLGQNLLALRIEADMLSSRTGTRHPHLHERACATLLQIDATIRSVRQIINDLRPNVLDLGLGAAVEWQISEFKRRTGIHCELVDNLREIRLNDSCATALFRILQESFSNIVRHAKATEVRVELVVRDGSLVMTVSDNGVGIQPGSRQKSGSFGLVGIEERTNILGGSFSITGVVGEGTSVHVSIPIEDDVAIAAGHPRESATDPTGVALSESPWG